VRREGEEVRVRAAAAHVGGLRGRCDRRVGASSGLAPKDLGQQQVPVLHALALALELLLSATQPAAAAADVAAHEHLHADPERRARSGARITGRDVGAVGPL
jgi:hypothetical protein